MSAPKYPPIFSALLEPKPRFAGFGKSTLIATSVYAGLLWGALSLPSTHAAQPKEEPELTVSLLDLPRAAQPIQVVEPAAGEAGEPAAAAAVVDPAPVKKPRTRAQPAVVEKPTTPEPKIEPQPNVEPALKVEPKVEAPEPKVSQPAATVSPAAPDTSKPAAASGGAVAAGGTGNGGTGGAAGSTGTGGGGSGKVSGGAAGGNLVVMPFGDGMSRPTLISKVDPTYSREALSARVEGLFIAKCVITTSGELTRCRAVKSLPYMDQAVLSALAKWRYSPVLYQGKPTSVEYVISVRLVPP